MNQILAHRKTIFTKKFAVLKKVVSLHRRYCCSGFGDSGLSETLARFLFASAALSTSV